MSQRHSDGRALADWCVMKSWKFLLPSLCCERQDNCNWCPVCLIALQKCNWSIIYSPWLVGNALWDLCYSFFWGDYGPLKWPLAINQWNEIAMEFLNAAQSCWNKHNPQFRCSKVKWGDIKEMSNNVFFFISWRHDQRKASTQSQWIGYRKYKTLAISDLVSLLCFVSVCVCVCVCVLIHVSSGSVDRSRYIHVHLFAAAKPTTGRM